MSYHFNYRPLTGNTGGGTLDGRAELIVAAGRRGGITPWREMIALEWQDIDLEKCQVCAQRSQWKWHVTVP